MARRYFNWKLAVVLVLGVSMLGVTAFGLRKWQKSQKSDIAYEKGNKAFDEHRWDEAASDIGRYISSNPEDIDMLHKYATAQLNRRPVRRANILQAINSCVSPCIFRQISGILRRLLAMWFATCQQGMVISPSHKSGTFSLKSNTHLTRFSHQPCAIAAT